MEQESSPEKSKKIKKRRHWFLRILLIVFIFLLTVQVLLLYFANPLLKSALKNRIYKQSNGLFTADFDYISFNLGTRSLYLQDFKLKPDINVYNKLKERKETTKALYAINFSSLSLNEIDFIGLLFGRDLHIKSIRFEKPLIRLIALPYKQKQESEKYDAVHKDLYPIISKILHSLEIDLIIIRNGYFDFFIRKEDTRMASTANNLSIVLHNFHLDENAYKKRDKLFYSDDIEIFIKDYVLGLQDSIHVLRAEEVAVSTSKSLILINDVSLRPEQVKERDLDKLESGYFRISIPEINITEADIKQIYFNKTVQVKRVKLRNPALKIMKPKKKREKNDKSADGMNLHKLISNKLVSLDVKLFSLSRGILEMYRSVNDKVPAFRIKNFSIDMDNFFVDSLSVQNKEKIFYADDIDLRMTGYAMKLDDNMHLLYADRLAVSTRQSLVQADNVRLVPAQNAQWLAKRQNKSILDVSVPNVLLYGADLRKFYNFKNLPIDSFTIENPTVVVTNFVDTLGNRQKRVKQKKAGKLNIITREYLNSITIGELVLHNGFFEINKVKNNKKSKVYSGNVNVSLFSFLFDPFAKNESEKFFFADDIVIRFDNYSMNIADDIFKFTVQKIGVSSLDSSISISEIKLESFKDQKTSKNQEISIAIENLLIDKTDIRKAYFDKIIDIGHVTMYKPVVSLSKYQSPLIDSLNKNSKDSLKIIAGERREKAIASLRNYLHSIIIEEGVIEKGSFRFTKYDSVGVPKLILKNKFDANLINFNFPLDSGEVMDKPVFSDFTFLPESDESLEQPFFSEDISLNVSDMELDFVEKPYRINADNIDISTALSEIEMQGVNVVPKLNIADSLKITGIVDVFFPRIVIQGIDINGIIKDKDVDIRQMTMNTGNLLMFIRPEFAGNRSDKEKKVKFALPGNFGNVAIKDIRLLDCNFDIISRKNRKNNSMATGKLSLNAIDFLWDSTIVIGESPSIPFSDDMTMIVDNAEFGLKDSIHKLNVGKVFMSTLDSRAVVKYLRLKPQLGRKKIRQMYSDSVKSFYDFSVDEININGLDYNALYANKVVDISSFNIKKPVVVIESFNPDTNQTVSPKIQIDSIDIYSEIATRLASVSIDNLEFEDAAFKLHQNKNNDKKDTKIDNISGQIKNLQIDSLSKERLDKFLYADDMDFQLKDYSVTLPDNLHDINTKEIGLSMADSLLYVIDLRYEPRYSKFSFAKEIGYQKGVISAKTDKLEIKGLDIKTLIEDKSLDAAFLVIENLDLDVFKDKYIPETHITQPPLPQQVINNIGVDFKIDTVFVNNTSICYEQTGMKADEISDSLKLDLYTVDTTKIGSISIDSMYITIANLTNDSVLQERHFLTLDGVARIMEEGLLRYHLNIPLADPGFDYSLSGELDKMQMEELNPLLEKLVFVSITNGKIKKMEFEIEANDSLAKGELKMRYKDLRIALLDKEKGVTNTGLSIGAFFANHLLLRTNNPKGLNFRKGIIHSERDKNKFVVHHWVQALITGVSSTLGFDSKDAKERRKMEKKLLRQTAKKTKAKARQEYKYNREKEKQERERKKTAEKAKMQLERKRKRNLKYEMRMQRKIDRKMKDLIN